MTSWREFADDAPALAALGRALFERSELVMLGTSRRDGSPRISPSEFEFYEDELTFGGIWRSRKAQDVIADSRCVLHSTTDNKANPRGDFKLYGRAVAMDSTVERQRYEAAHAGAAWLAEPYHLFRLDITQAAFVQFGEPAIDTAARLPGDPHTIVGSVYPVGSHPSVAATWRPPVAG